MADDDPFSDMPTQSEEQAETLQMASSKPKQREEDGSEQQQGSDQEEDGELEEATSGEEDDDEDDDDEEEDDKNAHRLTQIVKQKGGGGGDRTKKRSADDEDEDDDEDDDGQEMQSIISSPSITDSKRSAVAKEQGYAPKSKQTNKSTTESNAKNTAPSPSTAQKKKQTETPDSSSKKKTETPDSSSKKKTETPDSSSKKKTKDSDKKQQQQEESPKPAKSKDHSDMCKVDPKELVFADVYKEAKQKEIHGLPKGSLKTEFKDKLDSSKYVIFALEPTSKQVVCLVLSTNRANLHALSPSCKLYRLLAYRSEGDDLVRDNGTVTFSGESKMARFADKESELMKQRQKAYDSIKKKDYKYTPSGGIISDMKGTKVTYEKSSKEKAQEKSQKEKKKGQDDEKQEEDEDNNNKDDEQEEQQEKGKKKKQQGAKRKRQDSDEEDNALPPAKKKKTTTEQESKSNLLDSMNKYGGGGGGSKKDKDQQAAANQNAKNQSKAAASAAPANKTTPASNKDQRGDKNVGIFERAENALSHYPDLDSTAMTFSEHTMARMPHFKDMDVAMTGLEYKKIVGTPAGLLFLIHKIKELNNMNV